MAVVMVEVAVVGMMEVTGLVEGVVMVGIGGGVVAVLVIAVVMVAVVKVMELVEVVAVMVRMSRSGSGSGGPWWQSGRCNR